MRFPLQGWAAVLLVMAGCAGPDTSRSGSRSPSEAERAALGARAGMAAEEIRQAAAIYNLKCARCHKFYDPAGYDDAEWNLWMKKMIRKSRLKPEQEPLLSRYLAAFRQANPGPAQPAGPKP